MAAGNVIEMVPRAPIVWNQKSGTLDRPDSYMASVRAWRAAAREEAVQTLKLNPERDFVQAYAEMLEGRYYGNRHRRYRSRFFDNRLAEARLTEKCALTDIRPSMEVSCRSDVKEFEHQAEVIRKSIESVWDMEDLDLATEDVVDHAMFSVGYWKIGATMATDSLPARMIVIPCGMDQVLPIQPGRDIQDSSAVLYRVFKPLHRVRQAFGASAEGIERQISGSFLQFAGGSYPDGQIPEYTHSAMNPASRMQPSGRAGIAMASEAAPFASVEVEEYWIDDPTVNESLGDIQVKDPRLALEQHNYHYRVPRGERLFPRKRLMVWAGSMLLYDGPAPYWHGLYPFSQLILRPAVWRAGGISTYRNLVPLQLAMNKIGAGTLDLAERAVDPQMAFEDGALDDTSYRNFYPDRPGGTLKLQPNKQWGAHARYVDPPPLPGYVGTFMDRVDRAFDRQSGTLDVAGMTGKKQVPGGEVWEQARDTSQTVFRLDSRHVEPFMRAAGTQFVSNVFQYWSRRQRMWMLGRDGSTWQDFMYEPDMMPLGSPKEDHWRLFPVRIAAGSMHSARRDREKQLSVSLFRLGGISRREMLRTLGYGERKIQQIEEEIGEEHGGSIEPDAIGKGATPRLSRTQRTGNPF
jgi:hypothetical protein